MAATLAAAIAEVEGPQFDAIVGYTVKAPEPTPTDEAIAAAFEGFDYESLRKITRMLASRYRCHAADAEDAVHDALTELLVKRPGLLQEGSDHWLGLLHEVGRYRLIAIKSGQEQSASIESLTELAGDAAFENARLCIAASHDGSEDARYARSPREGERWTRSQVIGSLQRFRDYVGRPPRTHECKALNGLPSTTTIYRHFESLAEAILAAGMVPEAPQRHRRRWTPFEAARVCRSFRRRNGHWPNSADVKRRGGELPSTSVMIRCFGGTRSSEVQQGAEAILAGSEGDSSGRSSRR
jgi:DNA-directed RNA polymerase specialized sigma24 family protein